jgi:hypothetical protein
MALTFVVFVGYGLFAASVRSHVIARPRVRTWMRRGDWSFSVTPWLAVLLLFVLAQVFGDGARMRDDLTGTV